MEYVSFKAIIAKNVPKHFFNIFTFNFKDICECEKTLYFVPGLDVDGSTLQNLNPASNLTQKDLDILKLYGAKTE